jgi:COP9 signalosome complex subunit 7
VLPNHVSYLMAEVEQFKQADIDIRGHDDYLSESVGIMDFEEDRVRPKR